MNSLVFNNFIPIFQHDQVDHLAAHTANMHLKGGGKGGKQKKFKKADPLAVHGAASYIPPSMMGPAMFSLPGKGVFSVQKVIANSSNKTVYEVVENTSKKVMVIALAALNSQNSEQVDREIYFHKKFSELDPGGEYFVSGSTAYFTIDGRKHAGFLMPLMKGGDAAKYLKYNPFITFKQKVEMYYRMLSAVKKAHDLGIRHLDLKLENFLIDEDPLKPKLSDFGTCSYSDPAIAAAPNDAKLRSPEHVKYNGYKTGRKADIWALGVLASEMLGTSKEEIAGLSKAVFHGSDLTIKSWRDNIVGNLAKQSKEAADLVYSCLRINPADRPDIDQLIEKLRNSSLVVNS